MRKDSTPIQNTRQVESTEEGTGREDACGAVVLEEETPAGLRLGRKPLRCLEDRKVTSIGR